MRLIQGLFRLSLYILLIYGAISLWENYRTGSWLPDWFSRENKTEISQTVVLQEITSLGKLELVRYNFKDVVEQQITKALVSQCQGGAHCAGRSDRLRGFDQNGHCRSP